MQATAIHQPTSPANSTKRRAGFFPLVYGAVIAIALLGGGMADTMMGESGTGEVAPEAVAFVDVNE